MNMNSLIVLYPDLIRNQIVCVQTLGYCLASHELVMWWIGVCIAIFLLGFPQQSDGHASYCDTDSHSHSNSDSHSHSHSHNSPPSQSQSHSNNDDPVPLELVTYIAKGTPALHAFAQECTNGDYVCVVELTNVSLRHLKQKQNAQMI